MTTPASSTSTVHGLNPAPNNSLASAVSASAGMGGVSASAAVTAPVLQSISQSGTAANMTIELEFDGAMTAGSGTIYVTDGAVQTVIDRATGQPTMRVVGATDTHTIPTSSVKIEGNHVMLNVPGLLAGHQYSIVMGSGVLVSSAHVAFAGVRSTSQVQFTAPSLDGPALIDKSIESKTLAAGGSLHATLSFSQAVTDLAASALNAPNATIGALTRLDDGHTWQVELLPSGAVEAAGNMLALDMRQLHNSTGQAGTGSINIGSYAVDTKAPTATISIAGGALTPGHDLVATVTFSEAVASLDPAALQAQNASVKSVARTDDPKVWLVTLGGAADTTAGGNVLSLDMGKVGDLAGNLGSGIVYSAAYAVDTQAPENVSIELTGSTVITTNGGFVVGFTFSEAVKDFSSAINAPHAKVSDLKQIDGSNTWTATLQPLDANTSSGNLITLDMSKVEDLNGLHGTGSKVSSSGYAVDTVAPVIKDFQLESKLITTYSSIVINVTFSEPVNLTAGAITAPHASLVGLVNGLGAGDGRTWTITLSADDKVDVKANALTIDMSKVHDYAGNVLGSGSYVAPLTYDVDTKGPTATIALSGNELLNGGSIDVTITLSDKMSGADVLAALVTPNASHGALTTTDDGLTWKTILTPSGTGVVATNAVSLDLTKLHDAQYNPGVGSVTSASYTVDTVVTTYAEHGIGIDEGYSPVEGGHISNNDHQTFDGSLSASIGPGQILRLTFDDDNGKDDPTDKHVDLAFDNGQWHRVGDTASASETNNPAYWNYGSALTVFGDGVHTVRAQIIDGSHHSAAFTQTFTIDTTAPQLLTSPDGHSGNPSDDLVFTFNEALYNGPSEGSYTINFADAHGHSHYGYFNNSNFSADGKTLVIPASVHEMEAGEDYTITISSWLTDLAGNPLLTIPTVHFHTTGVPTASLATSLIGAGIYGIGKQIDIAVNFDEAVKVAGAGTPVLHLSNGGIASFDHFTEDHQTMVFRYVVGSNGEDDTHDMDSLALKDNTDLVGHVSDLAGHLLDQAHIQFSNFGVPWVDGEGHLHSQRDPGHPLQIDAHAPPAPYAPELAPSSHTGALEDSITKQNQPLLTGTHAASFATIKLFDNGTLFAQTTATAENTWQFGPDAWNAAGLQLSDGIHTLTVRQYDGANNESEVSPALKLTVDTVKPDAPNTAVLASDTGASDHDGLTNDATPTLSGVAAEAGGKIELYLNDTGTAFASADVATDKTWSLTVPNTLALADGTYNISVKQVDAAGNGSAKSATPLSIEIDTAKPAAPAAPILSAASDSGRYDNDGITKVKTPTFTGTASEAGGSVELYDGTTLLGTATVGPDKSWSFTVGSQGGRLAELADGVHTITVKQVDAAGNSSDASSALSVTIDTAAPVLDASSKALAWDGKYWYDLKFNEQVVFAAGKAIDTLDASNVVKAHFENAVATNWKYLPTAAGANTMIELDLNLNADSPAGEYHLKVDSGAIVDLAGNAAIVGTPTFTTPIAPLTS